VDAVDGTRAVVVDTRKTIPGYRMLEKYAVRCGGATNHRFGLYDAVLIKNNHLEFQPDPATAVRAARSAYPNLPLEIEVRDMRELESAVSAGPNVIMLDNFSPADTRQAVRHVAGRIPLESSGGITLDNIRAYAEAGVDRISIGAMTHSAPGADIHLRVEPYPEP
jgi:nicotinate-nucleotide pyrophosphorylase (carboxylating)